MDKAQTPRHADVSLVNALHGADVNYLPAFLHRFDREHTRKAYRRDLIDFFGSDYIDRALITQASFLHVNEYIRQLELLGRKPSTIKRRIAAIRGFFDWLEALQLVENNPTKRQLLRKVRSASYKDQAITVLTAKQAGDLLSAAERTNEAAALRNRTMILTMLHCVLRRSEVAHMNVEHVRPLGHYWVLDLPNTKGGSDQYVKIPAHVVDEIESMKQFYGITTGPLWLSLSNNSKGKRLSPSAIYEIVRSTASLAGLPQIGAHTLRHTGCTLAIESGASLQQVQTHARHKKIETTMVYIHQREKLKDSAADYIHIKQ